MKFEFDYWMLGVIESMAEKEKAKVFKATKGNSHRDCSYDCVNKLCDLGKANLILRAIDRERSKVTLKAEEQLISAAAKEETFAEIEERAKKESHDFIMWALQQKEFGEWLVKYNNYLREKK